jgi:hypothetical protein
MLLTSMHDPTPPQAERADTDPEGRTRAGKTKSSPELMAEIALLGARQSGFANLPGS